MLKIPKSPALCLTSGPAVGRSRRAAPRKWSRSCPSPGGSFERSPPHPASIPRGRRHAVLKHAQHKAVGLCLRNLLAAAGLPPVEPGHLPSGSRMWPAGYVGSVSHRGTRVVAVLGRRTSVCQATSETDPLATLKLTPPFAPFEAKSVVVFGRGCPRFIHGCRPRIEPERWAKGGQPRLTPPHGRPCA